MSTEESEKISVLTERIEHLIGRFDKFEQGAERHFVTQAEFSPIQRLVYGGVGIAMTAVLATLLGIALVHK